MEDGDVRPELVFALAGPLGTDEAPISKTEKELFPRKEVNLEMMRSSKLFEPYVLGNLHLSNRVAMAPMTRSRAVAGFVPNPLSIEYYGQRASAGLLVTEGSQISQQGQGYPDTPGIYTKEQVAGWRRVTDHVHELGGRIIVQLWHVGRISHVSFQEGGQAPVAPSPIRAQNVRIFVNGEFVEPSEPRALLLNEIPGIIESYRHAAACAMEAGFDGVEIHGSNGYLLDQFAKTGTNKRTDEYGGSIENRARLMLEVSEAVAREIGPDRTGIRIGPVTPSNDISSADSQPLFEYIVEGLDDIGLAFIHVVEGATGGARDFAPFDYARLRERFRGTYIANNGYDLRLANEALEMDRADMISFGRPFISNPDLVERLRRGGPFNEFDRATFYGGGAEGFTDYPALTHASAS
jgi:N-ethylmaleimide reductase